jgi:thiol-disulfide isomerase/thioredoxin
MYLQHILTNFSLGEQTIYEIIDTNSLVILDLFSEFCSVCIKSIPKLNKLNQSIKIIGLIETSQDLAHFIKMNNILNEPFLLSPAIKQNFNLNGNPNYILIGKNKEFLGQEYSVEKLLELVK